MIRKTSFLISPSILAADFAKLGEEAQRLERAGADRIHVDVMDGHFVPNLTFGPQGVAALNRSTSLFLDVHLMMYNPYEYVEQFVEAGADQIIFHVEATEDVLDTISFIRRCDCRVGLALNPETSVELLLPYIHKVDQMTFMTVNPGFGGQKFKEEVLEKIDYLHTVLQREKIESLDIEVDGGVDMQTASLAAAKGANGFVSGTYLFRSSDMKTAIASMRETVKELYKRSISHKNS